MFTGAVVWPSEVTVNCWVPVFGNSNGNWALIWVEKTAYSGIGMPPILTVVFPNVVGNGSLSGPKGPPTVKSAPKTVMICPGATWSFGAGAKVASVPDSARALLALLNQS